MLASAEAVEVSTYAQIRVEIEEIIWPPQPSKTGATKTTLFAGFIDSRSGCSTGSRAVYLHGVEKQKANFKFILEDGAKKSTPRTTGPTKPFQVSPHKSDIMQLLNPQVEQVELEQLPMRRSVKTADIDHVTAIDLEIIGVAASSPPLTLKFSVHSSEQVSTTGKLASQAAENFFQFSKNPKIHLDLAENLTSRTLILLIFEPYSGWFLGSIPISLKSLNKSSHVTLDLKSVRNEEFQSGIGKCIEFIPPGIESGISKRF